MHSFLIRLWVQALVSELVSDHGASLVADICASSDRTNIVLVLVLINGGKREQIIISLLLSLLF